MTPASPASRYATRVITLTRLVEESREFGLGASTLIVSLQLLVVAARLACVSNASFRVARCVAARNARPVIFASASRQHAEIRAFKRRLFNSSLKKQRASTVCFSGISF